MAVPSFFIYGEPDKPLDIGFLHVETVMERKQVHNGHVAVHRHNHMAQISFWTSGRGLCFIEDRRLDFVAPAATFVPSGAAHGFTVDEETSDAIVVSVADSALPPIQALSPLDMDRPLMVRGEAGNPLWNLLSFTMQRLHDDYRAGRLTSLAALIAVAANDLAGLAQSGAGGGRVDAGLAQGLKRLVDRHFRENWPVERYIDALATTPHLLDKACRAGHGLSVKAFIDGRRLLEAKRLLLFTVRSVEHIAYEIGFQDPAYFSRFFRQRTGKPPGQWRAERIESPIPQAGQPEPALSGTVYAGIKT